MSEITLEAIEAKQTELVALIAKYKADAPRILTIPAITIELLAGEHYAGAVLNADGSVDHHTVLMAARTTKDGDWQQQMDWAANLGGDLPSPEEASLIFANCKAYVPHRWHWTNRPYETDASYAWYCYFNSGGQNYTDKSAKGAGVAVRRLKP